MSTIHARAMRRDVLRCVGVPVRVGIASTKTLAKCANDIAKKNPIFAGVLDMMDPTLGSWLLPLVPVGDIWGIGRKTTAKLQGLGIGTAAELRDMPLRQARALGTVVLERTVLELQGEPCIAFDDVEPQRKGMAVTRSSGVRAIGLDHYGHPLELERRPECGAEAHDRVKCKAKVVPGKTKCRLHGGASTGPKTLAGRQRIAAAQRRRWTEFRRSSA